MAGPVRPPNEQREAHYHNVNPVGQGSEVIHTKGGDGEWQFRKKLDVRYTYALVGDASAL
jgi:hypothetical protein